METPPAQFRYVRVFAAAGLGLIAAFAFPPLSETVLILCSIPAFLLLIRNCRLWFASALGFAYGFAFAFGTMYWQFQIFGWKAILLMALMGAYFGLLGGFVGLTRDYRPAARALCVAIAAVGIEWLRGDAWYLRFPWYTPVHALALHPNWIAAARWLGGYGLSLMIWAFFSLGVFKNTNYLFGILLLPFAAHFLPANNEPDHEAILIQAESADDLKTVVQQVPDMTADVIVLPEYAYRDSPETVMLRPDGPAALVKYNHCPIIFGAVEPNTDDPDTYQNVAVVLNRDGKLAGLFPKQHPVPLLHDGTPGRECPVFALEQETFGVGVCFDFDGQQIPSSLVQKGATVLVVPTHDPASQAPVRHRHHELLLRLRAVENDRWILRAASSGRSEAIDPSGYPSTRGVEIGDVGLARVAFAHRETHPLGSRVAWFGPAAAAVTVLLVSGHGIGVLFLRRRRTSKIAVTGPPILFKKLP